MKTFPSAIVVFTLGLTGAVHAQAPQSQPRPPAEIEAEREQARFRAMDVNDDGIITRREWRGNARAFDRFDTNRDGKLSGSEIWIPANPKSEVARERGFGEQDQFNEELMQPFYDADRNNDRRLSRSEWWSDAATFARVDRNRDGFLTRAEYLDTDEIFDLPVGTSGNDEQKQTRAYRAAYERGLIEGRQAGKEDKQGPNKWDLEGQRELEQADSGYMPDVGRREDYQAGYRAGFRLGYRQGFGPRR
jgi:Ca2+-binding EF-hand superfamily protein